MLSQRQTIVKDILLGLMMMMVCSVIHVSTIVFTGERLLKRMRNVKGHPSVRNNSIILGQVFAMILLLHLLEIAVWAVVYKQFGLFNDFRSSWDFSLGTYTTNSAPALQLPVEWKLVGQLESISGPLLFGLSTAFLFLVMRKLFELRQLAHAKER